MCIFIWFLERVFQNEPQVYYDKVRMLLQAIKPNVDMEDIRRCIYKFETETGLLVPLYSIFSILYSLVSILYSLVSSLYSLFSTLYSIFYILYSLVR